MASNRLPIDGDTLVLPFLDQLYDELFTQGNASEETKQAFAQIFGTDNLEFVKMGDVPRVVWNHQMLLGYYKKSGQCLTDGLCYGAFQINNQTTVKSFLESLNGRKRSDMTNANEIIQSAIEKWESLENVQLPKPGPESENNKRKHKHHHHHHKKKPETNLQNTK